LRVKGRVWSFEHSDGLLEPRVVDQTTKGVKAQLALPNFLVAVNPAAQRLLAVVQMHAADPVQADLEIEFLHHPLVASSPRDVIARGEQVASIQTDPDPIAPVDPFQNRRQVLEAPAEAVSLSGGDLETYL
jgi:hypothetical protein